MPEFIEKTFKSILNKKKFIDSWFWDRYSINPYNGCLFGCVYCDARSAGYFMPEDFENQITIKESVGDMLDQRLSRARKLLPDVVGIGGVTDCYQPAEKKYRNTRQCLEVLAKHHYPVHLATKSTLVLEDLDILNQIGKDTWCTVSVSIPTVNPEFAGFLDFRSPSPQKRLDVVKQIKKDAPDVQTGILLIPMVPFMGDATEDLVQMVRSAKDAGADYLLFGGGMTMRDRQALWFLKRLKTDFPELIAKYEKLFSFRYQPQTYDGKHSPPLDYLLPRHRQLLKLCQENQLSYRIQRFIPHDYRKTNYVIAEMLFNEAYEKQLLGSYGKKLYWAAQNIQQLIEPIEDVARRGALRKITNGDSELEEKVSIALAKYAGEGS